jgi:hypothetical protein
MDEVSGKDFLVDTGATLSLHAFHSTAAATGPKLQSVKGLAMHLRVSTLLMPLNTYSVLFRLWSIDQ